MSRHGDRAIGLMVGAAYRLFARLPLDRASDLGGWLGRLVGRCLARRSRLAARSLARALPEKSAAEVAAIVAGMWEHLGRVAGEYPHLGAFDCRGGDGRIELVGGEFLRALRADGIGGIVFSAHLGNWELAPLVVFQHGLPLSFIYRSPNNPAVEALLRQARAPLGGVQIPKGSAGARALIRALTAGEHLGLLVDQKMNDGIPVPFFGRDAMTAPALAEFALRHRCPVVPIRVERTGGARFRVTVYPPLDPPAGGDRQAQVRDLMRRVNAIFEDWIRARPEQWLWIHNRWPD